MKTIVFNLTFFLLLVLNGFSQKTNNPNGKVSFDSTDPKVTFHKNPPPVTIQGITPVFQFDEFPINHNIHITSDGIYYYTINGGNAGTGQINMFDLTGTLIQTYPIMIDGRGLSYNKNDSGLYASLYTGDVVKITSLSAATYTVLYTGVMQDAQASFAISDDGTKFYDFFSGNLYVRDFFTGAILDTITGLAFGPGNYGGNAAVAVDANFIYTWDATIKTVSVYDLLGTFVQTLVLDSGDNGHSISVFDNKLFVSRDGNYAIGTWYGYQLAPPLFNFTNTCLGDSTFFTTPNTLGILGASWNFGDTASGINNDAYITNPYHIFSDSGTYIVQLIRYFSTTNDTINIPITVGVPPVFDLGLDTVICTGTTLLLNPGGGYSSYLWQDGSIDSLFLAVDSGLYFVTISNGSCSSIDSINIVTFPCSLPGANLAVSDTSFCEKQCLDFFDLTSNNPTSWQWFFPGSDSLTSTVQNPTNICYSAYGTFDVTLIACNASGCDTLHLVNFINEYQSPATPLVTANFDTLFSTPAYSYQWYNSSGIISGAINQYYVYQQQDNYYVLVTDSNGCAASSSLFSTDIAELHGENQQVYVYPNPNDGHFEVVLADKSGRIESCFIYDVTGRIIFNSISKPNSPDNKISLSIKENGIYLVQIKTGNKIWNKKIGVNR